MSAPDPLDSPIGGATGRSVCKDCRNAPWCASTKQCLIDRLKKSRADEEVKENLRAAIATQNRSPNEC